MAGVRAPRGTHDVLPDQEDARHALEESAARILGAAGYERIETPVFEAADLLERAGAAPSGFAFTDRDGATLALRSEMSAPIARAYVEHGMHELAQPVKVWYLSACFRDDPGGLRQTWQVGAEAIGSSDPAVDAELIVLLARLLDDVGVEGLALEVDGDADDAHLAQVRALLDVADLPHGPGTVAPPDRADEGTVFRFVGGGAADAGVVARGGRHDGLVGRLGGPATPGCGWAAGVEAILHGAGERAPGRTQVDLYVAFQGAAQRGTAFAIASHARQAGRHAQLELADRPAQDPLEVAGRLGARFAAIVREDVTVLRDMDSGEQHAVDASADAVVAAVQRGMGSL